MINLVYLTPNTTGGWVTFTRHLFTALSRINLRPRLLKCTKRTEGSRRQFGYGLEYRNMSLQGILEAHGPLLLVAVGKKFAGIAKSIYENREDCYVVIHDPTEDYLDFVDNTRAIVIREIQQRRLPGSTFIRHPYDPRRWDKEESDPRDRYRLTAVSTSRIDYDKRIELILRANNRLSPEFQCHLHGFENRLYTRFRILPEFPEWEQSIRAYPRTENAATELLATANLAVDMSRIVGDGGGTQYTWLEAWDAGTLPVIHTDWLRWKSSSGYVPLKGKEVTRADFPGYADPEEFPGADVVGRIMANQKKIKHSTVPDDMVPGENCLAVTGHVDLTYVLRFAKKFRDRFPKNFDTVLRRHDPVSIGLRYADAMGIEMQYVADEEWWESKR